VTTHLRQRSNDRLRKPSGTLRQAAGVLGVWLVLAAGSGCDTFSADLADLGESLFPPTPSEAAAWMFDSFDAEKRRRGTSLIAAAPFGGAEVYVRAYADRLDQDHVDHEENPIVIAALLKALARHGSPEHAPTIAEYLVHPSQQVRWEAARGLQRIHNPAVVPLLLAVMRNSQEDRDVRTAAAIALGQYPEDRVFQILVSENGLDARELALNLAAEGSLQTLTGQDFGPDPRPWQNWYRSTQQPFAGRIEYLYPTYSRDDTFCETIAFWSSNTWESPQQPAGLRPIDERRTYDDDIPLPPDRNDG